MMEPSIINQALILLINFTGICLVLWVYSANRRSRTNQIFSLMTVLILLWIDFAYLANLPGQAFQSLLWIRLNFGAIFLFFIAAYFFSIYFPYKEKRRPIFDKIVLGVGLFLCSLSAFTALIIQDVKFQEWGTDIVYGEGIMYFYGIVLVLTFLILFNLFKKYFVLSEEKKLRVQYFLIGVSLFALFNLAFNIIFPIIRNTHEYYQIGDYSAIFFLGFTAYAIVKHELFGIKIVLTTLFVGLITTLLVLDALIFTAEPLFQIIKGGILIAFLGFGYSLIKSVINEIERRKELERLTLQLEKANIELKRLDKAKSEFVSIASHQLRTPLTAIKGYVSMLLEGTYGEITQKAKAAMRNVHQSNERLIKLVNDLLSVSRIESGKLEMKWTKISLGDLILGVVEELKIKAEEKNLDLKWEKSAQSLPKIKADADKLRQIILNIIDNAIRYTHKGEITIKCLIHNSRFLIQISDTGEGMTEEELSKIFKSFSRGKTGTKLWAEGTGLGLYIAKQFVKMHQGKIWAESPGKGKGSTFFIELPIK